jgi:hypothetical protein
MYDILGKLQSLTPKQEAQDTPAKSLYESVEARGSIVAGVKDVEQKLREQFEAMKEGHYDVDDYTGGGQSRAMRVDDTPSSTFHTEPGKGENKGRPNTLDKAKSKLPADPFGRY